MNTLTLLSLSPKNESGGNGMLSVVMQISISIGIGMAMAILSYFERFYGVEIALDPSCIPSESIIRAFHGTFIMVGAFALLAATIFLWTPRNVVSKPKADLAPE